MRSITTDMYGSRRSPVLSTTGIVATSQPLASAAGAAILSKGGNAADAAVAAAAALQVTQPCSTGLGGDAFCLFYEAKSKKVFALNGSGRSPQELSLELLSGQGFGDGLPRFHVHTVTVPGAPAAWEDTVKRFGRLPLADVLAPSIRLAYDGFPVAPMAAIWWGRGAEAQLTKTRHGAELLLPNGLAPRAGDRFTNSRLGNVLERMATDGSAPFYHGDIAEKVVREIRDAGGVMTLEDLAKHKSEWVEPISVRYGDLRIYECPPNGQGLAALVALNILNNASFPSTDLPDDTRLHYQIEAMRIGFADATRYVSDPSFSAIPIEELLSDSYGAIRYADIDPNSAQSTVYPGEFDPPSAGTDTVYLCAVDSEGNGCSFINSNYMGFGTGIVPEGCGYSLQNRGHNFSLDPKHPNRLEPGKRPYHTIIPGIATHAEDESLFATFGVMGGFMQPQGHVQVISAMVDDDLDPQAALDRHRFQIKPGGTDNGVALEDGIPNIVVESLRRRGHSIELIAGSARAAFGLGQIVRRTESQVLWAGSDPRGDGAAIPAQ